MISQSAFLNLADRACLHCPKTFSLSYCFASHAVCRSLAIFPLSCCLPLPSDCMCCSYATLSLLYCFATVMLLCHCHAVLPLMLLCHCHSYTALPVSCLYMYFATVMLFCYHHATFPLSFYSEGVILHCCCLTDLPFMLLSLCHVTLPVILLCLCPAAW